MNTLAVVVGMGARTPVGLTAKHTAFLLRTGAAGFHEAPLLDLNEEPVTFGSVPTIDPLLVGPERLRQLAEPALLEAIEPLGEGSRSARVHVVLGLDEALGRKAAAGPTPADGLALDLRMGLQQHFAAVTVEGVARGEASAGLRLTAACERLAKGEIDVVLLGGVHSDYDPAIIERLSSLDRLFGAGNINGVLPGEMAAFVLLASPGAVKRLGVRPWAQLHAVGTGFEKAGPDNDEPAFDAVGLTMALKAATAPMEADGLRAGWMITDMTPEAHRAYEWQMAYVRSQKFLCEPQWIDMHANRLGRLGAAALPLHVALAATAWRHGFGPHKLAVSTVGSDSGERVATLWSDATA